MPTIFFKFGYRFYFVSFDCNEPLHIHVGNDLNKVCKYWLRQDKIFQASNSGFNRTELNKIEKSILTNYSLIQTKFYEHCKKLKK